MYHRAQIYGKYIDILSWHTVFIAKCPSRLFLLQNTSLFFPHKWWYCLCMQIIYICHCPLTEHHVMKACWESGRIAPRFRDLGTRWRWVVSFTPRSLYPTEMFPDTHWIGGWVGPRAGLDAVVERKIPIRCRDLNPRSSSLSPSPIPLSYSGSQTYIYVSLCVYMYIYILNNISPAHWVTFTKFLICLDF
jgi:hypothetical protein